MSCNRQFKNDILCKVLETETKEKGGFEQYTVEEIKENLLSVIIPVYNAEKGLRRCVESILSQTYQNLELLLVDDGSTDSSPELCDNFSVIDGRVRVFHIANSGPAEARNIGLLNMRGQYLAFVDADDYLELDMYELLIQTIKKENVQMVVCNWKNHEEDSSIFVNSDIGQYGKISAEQLRKIISAEDMVGGGGYPWNRVIDWKKVMKVVNTPILFPGEVNVYEDKIWLMRILVFMKDIMLLSDVKYHYILHEESLSHRKESDKLWNFLQAWELIDKEFNYALPPAAITVREKQTLQILWEVVKENKIGVFREAWPKCSNIAKGAVRNVKSLIKYCIMKGLAIGARN